jgi:hypothetical protein
MLLPVKRSKQCLNRLLDIVEERGRGGGGGGGRGIQLKHIGIPTVANGLLQVASNGLVNHLHDSIH